MTNRRSRVAGTASVVYLLAWVIGLSVFSSSTQVDTPAAGVVHSYHGHRGALMLQYLLTEGLAGVVLAVVVGYLGLRLLPVGRVRVAAVGAGMAAVAVSLLQCGLGLLLVTRAVAAPADVASVSRLFDGLNRLDGLKMLLLAATVTAAVIAWSNPPRWLTWLSLGLVVSICLSAVGYLFRLNTFATAAWLSLPLLIAWVLAIGTLPADSVRPGPVADWCPQQDSNLRRRP